jgi:hypothetical protein
VRLWSVDRSEGGLRGGPLDTGLDWFFRVATRFERIGVMGPEWRYAYWDTVSELVGDMTMDARREMYDMFKETGLVLTQKSGPVTRMRRADKVFKSQTGAGPLTRDDVHRIASDRASEHVQALYYDAHQRQQFWNAMRLAIPFGQAAYDSLSTWTRLGAQNPVQLYKAMRGFDAAMQDGSNVIYANTEWVASDRTEEGFWESPEGQRDAPWYDPRQGFMYQDSFGERQFVIPGLGAAMAGLTNLRPGGGDVPVDALQASMRVNNLNLLTGGGSPLPGLGPAVTYPLSQVMERATSNEIIYDWLFPVGEPDLGSGVIDQLLPSAVRRFFSAALDRNSQFTMANMGAASHYLMRNGDYDLYDQGEQDRFARDAYSIAQAFASMTAIAQFILPTVPSNVWVGEEPDGNRVGLAAASNLYYDAYLPMYDDPTQAQLAFLDDFGESFMYSFMGRTQGDRVISSEGWEMIRKYPEIRDYSEEFSFLFPGGKQVDFAALAWQNETAKRERLTVSQWMDQWRAYTYNTRRGRIEQKGIEQGLPDALVEADLAYLDRQIEEAGGIPSAFNRGSSTIEKVHAFLRDNAPDDLMEEQNVQLFLEVYGMREAVKDKAESIGVKSLDGKRIKGTHEMTAYLNTLAYLEVQYPEARPILRQFRNEVM